MTVEDTTITTTVCPSYDNIEYDTETTETELTLATQVGVSKPPVNSDISMKSNIQQAPITALGSLTGVFFIVLVAVIIGWVWTCWNIKKKNT